MVRKAREKGIRVLSVLLSLMLVLSLFAVPGVLPGAAAAVASGGLSFDVETDGTDVLVKLANATDERFEGYFIVAAYENSGKLAKIYIEQFESAALSRVSHRFVDVDFADHYKAYLWDFGYVPIMEIEFELYHDYFKLVAGGAAADIYVDAGDYPGIIHAADNLTGDIEKVTGAAAQLKDSPEGLSRFAVIAGAIGSSPVIDGLIADGLLDVSEIEGKWESYVIDFITLPVPGVEVGMVIAGSDKRGAIFGIYKISETIGVSPFTFFADSVPTHQDELLIPAETIVQGEPSVKYRGLFINDERQLEKWMEQYAPANGHTPPLRSGAYRLTAKFYVEFFDMILRQYGNYMWPAMWNNAFFTDDPLNGFYANEYGVVVGLSHQEFMNCPDKEWVWSNQGSFDWISRSTTSTNKATWQYVNRDNIIRKWTETMRATSAYETIPTLGLRGLNDTTAITNQGVDLNVMLLEDVTAAQMKIIEDVGLNVAEQQMNVTIYKEVETFYYGTATNPASGWKAVVDPNITLVVCDDNHGNTRALPMDINRERAGGFGMYYHFDYNGSPRSYRWVDATPLEKMREQMMMAYDYGVDRIWITNVGCIKFNEPSIDYWFKLGYDVEKWGTFDGPERARREFAAREFGEELADDIADVMFEYVHMNGIRKPEIVLSNSFSGRYFDEWTRMVDRAAAAKDKALEIKQHIPPERMDAYYNMVIRPVLVVWNTWNLMMNIEKNHLYASVGVTAANDFGQIAHAGMAYEDFTTQYTYGDPRIRDATYATTVNTIKTWLGSNVIDASSTPGDFYCVGNGKYYGYYTRRNLTSPYAVVSNDNIYYIGLTTWNHRQANGGGGGAKWAIGTGTAYNQVTTYAAAATTQMCVIPQPWNAPSGTLPNAKNGQTVALHKFTNYGDETRYVEVAATGNTAFAYTAKPDQDWIILSKYSGTIGTGSNEKIDKIYVAIDWSKVPVGTSPSGSITFNATNGNSCTVTVTTENFNVSSLPDKTFIETDNYISILSNNYARSVPATKDGVEYKWETLPDYGREKSSVKVTPTNPNAGYGTGRAHTPGVNSPYLEYNIYVKTPGTVYVITQWAPTNGVDPRQLSTLNYAVQMDNGAISTVNSLRSSFAVSGSGWTPGVENAVHTFTNENGGVRCISSHTGVTAGLHTIRIYMVNDGIVLQKLLVGAGLPTNTSYGATAPTLLVGSNSSGTTAVFQSYFGPPQTGYTGMPAVDRSDWPPPPPPPPMLASISIDGVPLASFNPAVRAYSIELDYDVVSVPEVSATASAGLEVSVVQAPGLPGTAVITVSSDAADTEYTVRFSNMKPKLDSISIDGVLLDSYSDTVYSYTYAYDTESGQLPDVTATASSKLGVFITQANAIPGAAVIRVSYGEDFNTYTVNFVSATKNWAASANGGRVISAKGANGNDGEGGASTNAVMIDGDTTGRDGATGNGRWRTNSLPVTIDIGFESTKRIGIVNVITQQPDATKINGLFPVPDLTTTTDLGLSTVALHYHNGTDWIQVTQQAASTLVIRQFVLNTPITTDRIRIVANSSNGWARIVEIEAWGT